MRDIIQRHYAWLVRMGYLQATPLESLALIVSEVGEATAECRGERGTIRNNEAMAEELADIILRTIGLATHLGYDIEAELIKKIAKNYRTGNKGRIL
jgi:NTP pyrophosphatase (non-canonical NTP hydrolase)